MLGSVEGVCVDALDLTELPFRSIDAVKFFIFLHLPT